MANMHQMSLFSKLSTETIYGILLQVDNAALFDFCDVYPQYNFFLREKRLVKKLDFQRLYSCDLVKLSKNLGFEKVTTLNMNNVYWVDASVLRAFVGKMKNLEELFLIGTGMGVEDADIAIYNRTKVQVLAISVRTRVHHYVKQSVSSVRSLYIQLFEKFNVNSVFPEVRKIWIDCEGHLSLASLNFTVPKYILQSKNSTGFTTHSGAFYESVTGRPWAHPYYIAHKDVFPLTPIDLGDADPLWELFRNYMVPLPFGPRDFRKLHRDDTMRTIKFYELFLSHKQLCCVYELREAYREILRFENCKKLKKLYVKSCVLRDEGTRLIQQEQNGVLQPDKAITAAEDLDFIFNNISEVEVFELSTCIKSTKHNIQGALNLIKTLKHLKCLNLEVPLVYKEGFLMDIFENCSQLEVLKLRSAKPDDRLNTEVCQAIPFGSKLKDFAYENLNIAFNDVITSLCFLQSQNIERLALVCTETTNVNVQTLADFLDANPQLIFIYFAVQSIADEVLSQLQLILDMYATLNAAGKVYLARHSVRKNIVPFVHFHEVLYNETSTFLMSASREFEHF